MSYSSAVLGVDCSNQVSPILFGKDVATIKCYFLNVSDIATPCPSSYTYAHAWPYCMRSMPCQSYLPNVPIVAIYV